MRTIRLLLALSVALSALVVIPLLPFTPITPAYAQSCTVIDTITLTAHNTTYTGSVATIAGREYEYRISGYDFNGALTYRDALWASTTPTPWDTPFQNHTFGYAAGILRPIPSGLDTWPSYSATHEYTLKFWGTGNPVTARVENDAGSTTNFTIEICEYPATHSAISCSIISIIDIDSEPSGYEFTPTLTNGNTYQVYFTGQTNYASSWPPTLGAGYTTDAYYSTTDNWASQAAFTTASFQPGSYTSTTLIDTTYQSDHVYQVDVVGNGSALGISAFTGAKGGLRVFVCDPSITPTPAPTSTPTITPTPVGMNPWGKSCILLGQANANFTAGNAWTSTAPMDTPPDTTTGVLLPSSIAASLPLKLSSTAQYRVETRYRLYSIPDGLGLISFQIGVGKDQDHYAPIAHVTDVQSFEYGPVNVVPNTDGLYHLILYWNTTPDPGLIIDWICVTQTSSGATNPDNSSGAAPGRCESCDREATGDFISDLFASIGWLWCAIRQVLDCVLVSIIYGTWTTIRHILGFIANIQQWAGMGIESFGAWLLAMTSSILYWLGGWIINLIQPLFSWLSNLITSVGSVESFLRALLGNTPAVERLIEFFSSMIRGVNDLIYVAQLLITGFQTGVTSTTTIPVQYAPQCFDPSSILYYPCLGFYVAENTVLEGPVWLLIPFVMGIISWNVGFWAIRQVIKVFSSA